MDILDIKNVGEKTKVGLEKLGIETIEDLISYVPRGYDKYEDVVPIEKVTTGKIVSIEGLVISRPSFFNRGKMNVISCIVDDGSAKIRITWYHSPFIMNTVWLGKKYVFRGRAYEKGRTLILNQPRVYKVEEYEKLKNRLAPVYHISKNVKNVTLRNAIENAFIKIESEHKNLIQQSQNNDILANDVELKKSSKKKKDENETGLISNLKLDELYNDYLPKSIIEKRNLYGLGKAYYHMHFPKDNEDLINARKRLVYDEFFLYELGLMAFSDEKKKEGISELVKKDKKIINNVIKNLPYKLTASQEKVLDDIWEDFDNKKLINRLIQGDVGSGKTIVAFLMMLYVSINGFQSVLMAPTEVLANQHYANLSKIIKDNNLDIKVAFLAASISAKEKKNIKDKIKKGEVDIIIGTHAVITDDVEFDKLALIIIDEQQRFGVNQRKTLEGKSDKVNIIHLSATPIPRTLSLMLFSGLDISKIDEKPNNRVDIKTAIIGSDNREKAYKLMLKEVEKGNRCYIVCPMIDDENDDEIDNNYESVKEYAKKLDGYIPKIIDKNKYNIKYDDVKIGVLHGKMKQKDKDKIMKDFYDGIINVLVSTTVIEVGIDCKDATFMMVENAECFGLATIHQLRGRVGRSDKQSYCIFVDTLQSDKSKERLKVLFDSNDGFYIADQDLKLRGAGDVFGVKQSGEMGFKIGDIYNDKKILEIALEDAKNLIKEKNVWENVENALLKRKLDDYVKNGYTI